MEIPEEAFSGLLTEIRRRSLDLNAYRVKSGKGRTVSFGIVCKRCVPPDYSRQCWRRPYLYKLLLDFAEQYVSIPWNAVTVNQNYAATPHYDNHNIGDSYLVAFGNYEGGELKFHEGEKEGLWNVRHSPMIHDFAKTLHSAQPFTGERYSLVFYQYKDARWPIVVPPATVVEVDGEWVFKRGDELIYPTGGLPHPRKGKKDKRKIRPVIVE